jgi:hypothetical protein
VPFAVRFGLSPEYFPRPMGSYFSMPEAFQDEISSSYVGVNITAAISIEDVIALTATYMWVPSENLPGRNRLLIGLAKQP